jgi:chemotaxis protein methyltransferase CheR
MSRPARAARDRQLPEVKHADYLRFAQTIEAHSGLYFPEKRRAELERGLLQAFAASTCQDLDEYYDTLQNPETTALEMDRLLNALTVGETYFFRDAGQFDALYNKVLPEIIARRQAVRTLRIWSAGCASGEEPYSLAILLRELLPDVDEWAITILGTDVNTEALARARKATYGNWAFREERARQCRTRYFSRQDKQWILKPQVQRMVTFHRLNLASDDYPSLETNTTFMDLILCRNVTIYFTADATHHVVERLYHSLVDSGWLVVGHSEPSPITYRRFQAHTFPHAVLYQRTGQPTRLPQDWEHLGGGAAPEPESSVPRVPPALPAMQPPPEAPSTKPLLAKEAARTGEPLERARELLDYGYSGQARDLLLEIMPAQKSARACSLLGQAYANLGNWQEAERWCSEAIQLDRLALEAYYTLALVLQHQGRLDEAIDAMKKVVYIDRHYVLGHFGLADLYRNREQWPQAQKALDNARRLLDARPPDEMIPGSGGVTTGRLRETVIRQQQQWEAHIRA